METDKPPGTGAERILAAAVDLLGRDGIAATSLKAIATEAGVSQALIIHHFGSKEGLRRACDSHVNQLIRARKEQSIDGGPHLDPLRALREMENGRPLLRYLVRTLAEGGDHVDALIDEMVADAEEYTARGVEKGIFKPSAAPRERVVLLVLWSLGGLVLHEHMHRLLGVDLLSDEAGVEGFAPYMRPVMDIFTNGLMVEGAYEELIRVFDRPAAADATAGTVPGATAGTVPDDAAEAAPSTPEKD